MSSESEIPDATGRVRSRSVARASLVLVLISMVVVAAIVSPIELAVPAAVISLLVFSIYLRLGVNRSETDPNRRIKRIEDGLDESA